MRPVLINTQLTLTWTLGFNFLSHGSQDLFPTYMQKDKGFSAHDATIATIIGNCVRFITPIIDLPSNLHVFRVLSRK